MRPPSVSEIDIGRWDALIGTNAIINQIIPIGSTLREVVYMGHWLEEQLLILQCNPELILRIQYTAGSLSTSDDPWTVAQIILSDYRENKLEFSIDYDA